jgi:hypothetical protein
MGQRMQTSCPHRDRLLSELAHAARRVSDTAILIPPLMIAPGGAAVDELLLLRTELSECVDEWRTIREVLEQHVTDHGC